MQQQDIYLILFLSVTLGLYFWLMADYYMMIHKIIKIQERFLDRFYFKVREETTWKKQRSKK